ncbi:PLC-like phosphodiesterase [Hirsutella rhossiliensis]|uniref:PLC-like phosphodiesterase n=1 Tax=Hirsutella rhossiliensis TaxID=111463 RepID=A0A9P8MZ32_9HYPO|nr:PLC-like phosphodiesterase [Hirsutella rhossiliensis]KAH0962969.1 PLC-like phosphodiesterase [Hirsutella rhossiliensis]
MVVSVRALAVAALAAVAGVVDANPQAAPSDAPSIAPTAAPPSAAPSAGLGSGSGTCNNSPLLCSRQYNKITHMGAHDSSFLRDKSTRNSPAGNQFKNATIALDAGFRLLQTQVHKVDSGLRLCHTSCGILDAGPLDTWLAAVADWVSRNPNDVITIVVVNSDKVPATDLGAAFERSGITKFAYKPASTAATTTWPTLGTMIGQRSQVVIFTTNTEASPALPYMLPHFVHIFETPFEVTQLNGFNCTLDRPKAAGQPTQAISNGYMSLVNHFKDQPFDSGIIKSVAKSIGINSDILVPDVDRIDTVNNPGNSTDGNLGKHLDLCSSEWGQQPNFILVDFWDRANPIEAADRLNGVSSTTGRKAVDLTSAAPRELGARATGVVVACLTATSLWLL